VRQTQYAFAGRDPKPVGVCGQIIPWNFPLLMMAWKLAPALACGNTCVLKPAETTPLTALRLAEIFEEIGCRRAWSTSSPAPATGGPRRAPGHRQDRVHRLHRGRQAHRKSVAGPASISRSNWAARARTSSSRTPAIDQAVEGVIQGIYFNQGHVCCAGSRLFVQEGVAGRGRSRSSSIRMQTLRVGDPLDKNTDVGAINSRAAARHDQHVLDTGRDEGAQLFEPSCHASVARATGAGPVLLHRCAAEPHVAREEIFGPVLAVQTFRTPEEAITRANNTPYGLAAGVWTDKGSKIFEIAGQLKAGVVWCNTYNRVRPRVAVRRVQGIRLRPRRRHARPSRVLGCHNPVSGPYHNFTIPEAVGVVAVIAPQTPALLGLLTAILPPLSAGNTIVVFTSEKHPIPAVLLGEVCATSDVPGGVVNILTGLRSELLEHVSTHREIDAISATDVSRTDAALLRAGVAENLKRVHIQPIKHDAWDDPAVCESPWTIEPFVEMKTIWHPSAT
jgi:acyl-CoA reductase-like NAD-dependent aldehyde dehydrogenase